MSYHRPRMPLPDEGDYINTRNSRTYSSKLRPLPPLPPRQGQFRSDINSDAMNQEFSEMGIADSYDDIFHAISTDQPLSKFPKVSHPVPLPANTKSEGLAIATNKFYGNMMVGDQTNPVWTHPYSLFWSKDYFMGIALSYVPASERVFGPNIPAQYFFGPVGIKSFVFGALDFTDAEQMSLGFTNLSHLQVHVQLRKNENQYVLIPLVQGMGFASAVYYNMIPKLYSAVGYKNIIGLNSPRAGIQKYKIVLENNMTWTLYVTVPSGQSLALALASNNQLVGSNSVNGCLFQLVPDTNSAIDAAAGCYPSSGTLSGSVDGEVGKYTISYELSGSSNGGKTLMYACPHHVSSFKSVMSCRRIDSHLDSVTMGRMTGYLTTSFEMEVHVPAKIGFDPYSAISGKSSPNYSEKVLDTIRSAAASEAQGDVCAESNLDSMYFSGKILAKYAWILYVCHYVIKDSAWTHTLMENLKAAIARFIDNSQLLSLRYDTTWGGIISSGDSSQDFGNSYYNDHHFHYAYHVITAAILAKIDQEFDGNWLEQNKSWVENLIRDYSNPSSSDPHFPVFRSFDWFVGHSWAKGLFPSGDGKDQESSSEDANAAYAIKLWGNITGNQHLENIGNLELGILQVSLNSYFLYSNSNSIEPSQFIANKVSGILFENKIDHTTYFGNALQYIQMIHAIPITPISAYIRSPTFVQEEWVEKLASIVDNVHDGWKGIMILNRAIADPSSSYKFFSDPAFSSSYLDNGQSRTWSLTYSGALL
ncbi:LADA_0G05930g1_1 [Lachancea dasiensis]|uniref:glucan endo-1,3-beta-D-glucosidase n=1 Tax=Lachancea dasiensis TaxID=1072105 RepID=A0A1G4JT97_9SACH|nr:LADA_0G05930g1_1 [Lachancea dasiensis]